MGNLVLSPIPMDELINSFRAIVKEEIAASRQSEVVTLNTPPVTQKELAKFLNVTPQTVIKYDKEEKIPHLMIGKIKRYDIAAVVKALSK